MQPPQEPSPPQSQTSPEFAVPVEPDPSVERLVGVDLARALAVFGMYVVHIAPRRRRLGADPWRSRSSALFATLPGSP